jgi:hypothetical protein
MRKMIIATAASLLVGGAGVLALAVPASAATTAGTPVTVEITGGGLAISAPALSVDLGSKPGSASAQTVTAQLGPVLVTDLRAGILGWVATAGSTDFTGAGTIPASAEAYTPGSATVVGIATVTPTSLTAMTSGAGTVETATAVIGVNTAGWNPSIAVMIPAGAVAGTYSATITHSGS